jgi:transposase
MARERRVFSEEFKREAVKLVGQPGASKAAIARDLGIGANLLGRWCRDANVDAEVAVGREKVSAQEYERMRRELAKVKMERDILKKALAGSTGHRNSSVLMAYQGGSNATNWPARIITSRKIGTLESMEGWSVTK